HLLVPGIAAPERDVLRPQPLRDLLLLGDAEALLRRVALLAGLLVELHRPARLLRDGPALDGAEELIERLAEEIEPLVRELLANLLEIDADLSELLQLPARLVDALDHRLARDLPVIVEGLEGGERHGVDGVPADERLDVQDVAVRLVLGPGRSPERPLPGGALRLELLPAIGLDAAEEDLVGLLGVGDCDLSLQVVLVALRLEELVHRRVHAADEEARHAVD